MNVTGEVTYWKIQNGVVVQRQHKKNMIVSLSRKLLGNLTRGFQQSSALNVMAIGTGSIAPDTTDTTLGSEVYRMALPAADTNTPLAANTITLDPVQVTFRQTLTPFAASSGTPAGGLSGTHVITEFGLFGDVQSLTNPASAPTIGSQDTTGTTPAEDYNIKFTWVNGNGETAASAQVAHTQSSTGSFTVNLGTAPVEATKARLYINTVSVDGNYYLYGTEVTDLTSDPVTFNVAVDPPTTGTQAPSTNTSTVPGALDSGTLFNRALIGEPGGVSISGTDQIMIESKLTFG